MIIYWVLISILLQYLKKINETCLLYLIIFLQKGSSSLDQLNLAHVLVAVFCIYCLLFFFFIWVFFHEHSWFTGQQGKSEAISLIPLYHFHLFHRHLDISRAITAESSPLLIASSQIWTGNLWLQSSSR